MQLMSSSLDLWKIKEWRPYLQCKEARVESQWLQNMKKVVFSTFVSDKCLILAANSMSRSEARKSASVLWDKVADFVNSTCIPLNCLFFFGIFPVFWIS